MTTRQRGTLNRDLIARAALGIADREGLERLTIRAVAKELDVSPMSLYTHVDDKDDLFDAMLELAFEGAKPPDNSGNWQQRLEDTLLTIQKVFSRHPSVFLLTYRSRDTVENLVRLREAVFECLLSAGLSPADAALLYRTIGSFAVGHVFLEQQSYVPHPEERPGEDQVSKAYRNAFQNGDPIAGVDGFFQGLRLILSRIPTDQRNVRDDGRARGVG